MTAATMGAETDLGVRVNRRRLVELALYSSVLTTMTAVLWWLWLDQIAPLQLGDATVVDLGARLRQFLSAREIFMALALAELFLGWAVLLALTPLGWWLESDLMTETAVSPVQMLAQAIRKARAPQTAAEPDATAEGSVDLTVTPEELPAGSPIPAESTAPGVAGTPSNPSAQHKGAPPAGQPGAPDQTQPGQAQAAPATPAKSEKKAETAPPPPPQSALQALTGPEGESPLDDLGDMSDLMAVFDDDAGVEQWLLDLSGGLADLEIEPLATTAAQVLRDLRAREAGAVRTRTAPAVSVI